ncbi:NAD(P)-dependent oxidoreductase [Roseinatronobacter sp. S2]|uniref:NAD-dependent epimerase/dehydratase family protein n=1 Tax=Roseinatronobacter sp. S2 TaxID=3035471 RepID=UPI0024108FB7|nr:NAD-dependent epimerase/dehydratase family protein [Roseinatronobacter sp. S2]WFE75349.1 NAD-dependent epimerase/dehydratase family protein [Roseinatronobacter sp. S2]
MSMPMQTDPIVVFGGTGFVGGHLLNKLKAIHHGRIISVDAKAPALRCEGVEYVTHDVRDLTALDLGCEVPTIFNLAAVHTTPGHAPWEYYDTNVRGAIQIARFARAHKTRQICFTSSISIYGPSEAPKDETAVAEPESDYGRSKLMAEYVFSDWVNEAQERRLVITRPAVVFGPREGGNFTRLARMLQRGLFVYPGRQDTIKSCIYVDDLIEWMLYALEQQEKTVLFNAAFHDRYTIKDIVETFRAVAFPKARTLTLPAVLLKAVATVLQPISRSGLGVHPERIEKLMRSTNILPAWADAQGLPTKNRLRVSLESWREQTNGDFS